MKNALLLIFFLIVSSPIAHAKKFELDANSRVVFRIISASYCVTCGVTRDSLFQSGFLDPNPDGDFTYIHGEMPIQLKNFALKVEVQDINRDEVPYAGINLTPAYDVYRSGTYTPFIFIYLDGVVVFAGDREDLTNKEGLHPYYSALGLQERLTEFLTKRKIMIENY
jgi:hypothetical protein